jgi:putative membrane protein
MLRVALIAVCLAMVAGSANSQSLSERTGINAFFGISPSTQDFISQVALGEMFQVEIGKLAQLRESSGRQKFVEKMLEEHRTTSSQLRALVDGGSVRVTLPAALDGAYQARLDRLKALRGVEFEKEFDQAQIDLHKDIISLFERYGSGGSHPDLKRFAYRHLPHILQHWRLAKEPK